VVERTAKTSTEQQMAAMGMTTKGEEVEVGVEAEAEAEAKEELSQRRQAI